MQRIVLAITGAALLSVLLPATAKAQSSPGAGSNQSGAPASDTSGIQPLLPPGISDFNIELFGKLAYTWTTGDGSKGDAAQSEPRPSESGNAGLTEPSLNVNVVEIQGNFSARMGQYKLAGRDAVVWFRRRTWRDHDYLDVEIFLWQGAEVLQPGGTVETGPALLVTLRSFGKIILNADSRAAIMDEDGDLYREGLRARGLLKVAPPVEPEASESPVQVAPTAEALLRARPKPAKVVSFSADQLYHEPHDDQAVVIAIGDVLLSQGSPAKSGEFLELQADAAVIYLRADKLGAELPGMFGEEKPASRPPAVDLDRLPGLSGDVPPEDEPSLIEGEKTERQAIREWVSAVYLEGDVVLMRGQRMIRASKLYYDFENDRALILDVVMRALEPSRGLPIYVRADRVRQLSATEYTAERARITTSEFYTPHTAIGAGKVTLIDRTPRNERGEIIGIEAGTYEARNTTLNVQGVPIAYWPFSRGDFSRDRMAFRSAKAGYNSDFGTTFETRWYLFNLLGLVPPEGYDATLKLDYFTDRGPAVGIDMDYEQDDYFGLLRTYYIRDDGDDHLGGDRGGPPDHRDRGRVLWRHRQYLPKGWELSLEASYISDDNFLESFERQEWENGKDQETALYLVKRQDNWQFSTLANWRVNEFLTQTEHLPDAAFSLIGEPLGDYATWYHESRAGVVRYRPDNRRFFNGRNRRDNTGETGAVARGDLREELQFPIPAFGPLKITPYVMGRGTAWDDSPSSAGGGGVGRYFAAYGVRGNMYFSKVYDSIESQLFDLHRLRHIIKADAGAWNAHSNRSPRSLTPFDSGVEDIDDFGGGTLGLRQRFQTQRGGPGRWRTVDWITFDLEAGFFNDAQEGERTHGDAIFSRPEDSISSNFLAANLQYRISDTTMLIYDGVYDWNRGNVGTSNVSLAVERLPRLAYFVGWRYIHDTDNNLLGLGANYRLSEKHTVAVREFYDVEEGRNFSTALVYIRRWPRWYTAITFDIDRTLDDIGINFSIWPEGAPGLALGSKRYTGLAESIGIRP